MIRESLKEALLDLRGQLRSRKASAYIAKIEKEHDEEPASKSAAKDDSDADKPEPKRSGAAKTEQAVSEGMDQLSAQIREFMKRPRSKPLKEGDSLILPGNNGRKGAQASPAVPPKAKGKSK